jgi:hypothetical protein
VYSGISAAITIAFPFSASRWSRRNLGAPV